MFGRYSGILILLCCALSCSNRPSFNKANVAPLHQISLDSVTVMQAIAPDDSSGHFLGLIDSNYCLVKLETKPGVLVGNIDKIISVKGRYFILDQFSSSSAFIFDQQGKFISRIGSKGLKEDQYTMPSDMIVDTLRDQVLILDGAGQKINYYDLNGRFLRSTPLDFLCNAFDKFGSRFAFSGGGHDEDRLIITDSNFQKIATFYPLDPLNAAELPNPFFGKSASTCYYRQVLNDTIFRLDEDGMSPYLYVDFGKWKANRQQLLQSLKAPHKTEYQTANNFMCNFVQYYEMPELRMFSFTYQGHFFGALQSLTTGKIKLYSIADLKNDVLYTSGAPPIVGTDNEGSVFSFVTSAKILIAIKKWKEQSDGYAFDHYARMTSLVTSLGAGFNEFSNPVIIKYRFKPF